MLWSFCYCLRLLLILLKVICQRYYSVKLLKVCKSMIVPLKHIRCLFQLKPTRRFQQAIPTATFTNSFLFNLGTVPASNLTIFNLLFNMVNCPYSPLGSRFILLQALEGEVAVAKIDATANNELAQRYEVQGYPTIKILKGDTAVKYDGSRTEEGTV